jgi:hypothetical protein
MVIGQLQVPASARDVSSLSVRVRAYRPGQQGFVIANEAGEFLEKAKWNVRKLATGQCLYTFSVPLTLPREGGEYLLRVDCLDLKVATHPRSLVATTAVFLHVHPRTKP